MFQTKEEALQWLYNQKKLQRRTDLSRIQTCLQLLQIQIDYQVIHIAGTNGKGSTACYLNQMLYRYGKKVGLFVSPYVVSFNERIEVNGTYISDEDVLLYTNQLANLSLEYQKEYGDILPFFELTFLMALLYFSKMKIDILVLETGMGGLLDPTNAIKKDVAIITNIGYDHMSVLGNTLEEIASHKLGITRENVMCFTAVENELMPFFENYCISHNVPLNNIRKDVKNIVALENGVSFQYQDKVYHASLCGIYQAYNAALALAAMTYLFPKVSYSLLQESLQHTFWPGRFEKINSYTILDGAHNLHGIKALCESLALSYPKRKIKVVFTALKDKNVAQMLKELDQIAEEYFFTSIEDNRALPIDYFIAYTTKPYQLYASYKEAITKALASLHDKEILVITGSLHFISVAREYLQKG